jgi:hypothetical protein
VLYCFYKSKETSANKSSDEKQHFFGLRIYSKIYLMSESGRCHMETREMTKEQLIAQIDALNEQVVGLKKTETPDKKVEADLQASDD